MNDARVLADGVQSFVTELGSFDGFDRRRFTVAELRAQKLWGDWAGRRGVYAFVYKGEVVYIGRALGSTLGERVDSQLRARGDARWVEVVSSAETEVILTICPERLAFLASSLEALLIEKLRPLFNMRAQ